MKKKLLAVLLVPVLALSLTACEKSDAENIVGLWQFEQTFESELYDIESIYTNYYVFNEDGTFRLMVNAESWEAMKADVAEQYRPQLEEELEEDVAEFGQIMDMTLEELFAFYGVDNAADVYCAVLDTDMDTLVQEYVDGLTVPSLAGTYEVSEEGHCILYVGEDDMGRFGISFVNRNTMEWYYYTDAENRVREAAAFLTLSRVKYRALGVS